MGPSPLTRRRFLGLAGVAAGMGLLAACQPAARRRALQPARPRQRPSRRRRPPPLRQRHRPPLRRPRPQRNRRPPLRPTTRRQPPSPAASAANTLTFLWGGDTDKLDPPAMDAQEGFIATTAMYEGLVRYKSDSTDVEPALAEKWDVSPDGMEYIFHLRPGVKFHDGSPLTAEAVAFSFDRSINKDNPLYQGSAGRLRRLPVHRRLHLATSSPRSRRPARWT